MKKPVISKINFFLYMETSVVLMKKKNLVKTSNIKSDSKTKQTQEF